MKTPAKILTGLCAVVWSFSGVVTLASHVSAPTDALLSTALMGQGATSADRCKDLLRRARQAMTEGNLDDAEALIARAESLGVKRGPFYLGDTPERARRELQRKRNALKGSPILPSQIFKPLSFGRKKTPAKDPFSNRSLDSATAKLADKKSLAQDHLAKGRQALDQGDLAAAGYWHRKAVECGASFGPNDTDSPEKLAAEINRLGGSVAAATDTSGSRQVNPLPPVNSDLPSVPGLPRNSFASPTPFGRSFPATRSSSPSAPNANDGRQQPGSSTLLLEARRALAVGDVQRATKLTQQADALNINYQLQDDTPDKVRLAIRDYQDLMSQRAARRNTEAYRRQYARIMMKQAEALLQWNDHDEAERLALNAGRQRVIYSPFETKPEDLLERIALQRRNGRAAHASLPVSAVQSPSSDVPAPSLAAKQRSLELVRQARAAFGSGDLRRAETLALQAKGLQIPDSAFAPGEDRPALILMDIRRSQRYGGSGVVQTSGAVVTPATGPLPQSHQASRALYDPTNDRTRNVPAQNTKALPVPSPPSARTPAAKAASPEATTSEAGPIVGQSMGMTLFRQGEAALRAHEVDKAVQLFRQAAAHRDQLDPLTWQRLQDHLQLLSTPAPTAPSEGSDRSMIDDAAAKQQLLARQMAADVAHQESAANKQRETDPKAALSILEEARKKVVAAGLEPTARNQLLRRLDRSINEMRQFIEDNRPRIELNEKNQKTRQDIEREQKVKLEVQEKLAVMCDEFNRLIDEQRYAEAEVVAKRAAELDPENPVVRQLMLTSKFVRRVFNNMAVRDAKEEGFLNVMAEVDEASVPFAGDKNPLVFPDAKQWQDLTKSRAKYLAETRRRRSERELEIEQKLKTPVSVQFENKPLSLVLDNLAKLAQINMHVDQQGLAEEGITSDTPVTINLNQEIMLKSALHLILEPLHLDYVIKDEVLKITSEQLRDGEVYTVTYSAADLVVPIPNFVPSPRMGLAGALHNAYGDVGFGNFGPFGGGGSSPLAVLASKDGNPQGTGAIHPTVMAQMSGGPSAAGGLRSMPLGPGPGGLGGGVQADFDSLIELITTTIQPTTWDEVGGPGSIAPFETNLSLVVSQTQDVHEEIVDLLEQLRRLQDLQVTIEVRFITLNDNFFERIGVDFDFDVANKIPAGDPNNTNQNYFGHMAVAPDPTTDPQTPPVYDIVNQPANSVTVGLDLDSPGPGQFSADLDIPFRQNSYGLAVPQFGGYDPSAGAQLGFAILSDIEAYFFINAAQGDRRTNVLQAPKVTLFNGQQAFVSDTSQSPFVISVIPVVGDFAAAQQPVIVVLSEGTFLTVQAVISNDRRFVRLTVVPFFSQIGDVNTFQFTGTETTTTNTSSEGPVNPDDPNANPNAPASNENQTTTTRGGTTVQLPTFSFITVTTTVSVPDGGTVLLGGIKRLNEGRSENGVPMLNKIPYINRLFQNVGIGRETQSLMMMVTPRIIIQEEEEEKLGILPP